MADSSGRRTREPSGASERHENRVPKPNVGPYRTKFPISCVPPEFDTLPFTSVYLTDNEWAAEMANRTVHGVMHIGWVPDEAGGYRGQMAVLVKPNGLFGRAYMAGIAPFRHLIVYPPLMRDIGQEWRVGMPQDAPPAA